MAVLKCKMCGGNIVPSGNGFGICDSCGTPQTLTDTNNQSDSNTDNNAIQKHFTFAVSKMNNAKTQKDFEDAAALFKQIGNFQNSPELAFICETNAEEKRCEEAYNNALRLEVKGDEESLLSAVELFKSISNYKDSSDRALKCEEKLKKSSSVSKAKNFGIYITTAIFIILKLVCSCIWASKLNPLFAIGDMKLGEWIGELLNVMGLMALEVVLTSIVSVFSAKCKIKKLRLGGIIMFVLTLTESFIMSVIDNPQVFSSMHRKVFIFYFIFSIICNFTLYILMLIFSKIKKSLTK